MKNWLWHFLISNNAVITAVYSWILNSELQVFCKFGFSFVSVLKMFFFVIFFIHGNESPQFWSRKIRVYNSVVMTVVYCTEKMSNVTRAISTCHRWKRQRSLSVVTAQRRLCLLHSLSTKCTVSIQQQIQILRVALINLQKLTSINQLISNNFGSH